MTERKATNQGTGQPLVVGLSRAAEIADASPSTVRRWIQSGRLQATRVVNRGSAKYKINLQSLLDLLGVAPDQQ